MEFASLARPERNGEKVYKEVWRDIMYETTVRTENPFKKLPIHVTVQCGDLNPCTYGASLPDRWEAPCNCSEHLDLLDDLLFVPGAVLFIIPPRRPR